VNVYDLPFVNFVMVAVSVVPLTMTVCPIAERTMYALIVLAPELAGAAHEMVALALPAAATTFCGALGA
jgi:hypothetical protein